MGAAAPPAEPPLVLIGREGRRRVVLAADRAAGAAGLYIGMPVTKAQALARGLIVKDADPAADAEALERLALWALKRYAPIAAADPPDGIVIDVFGAAHLFGGEDAMARDMVARIEASGVAARAALADSWGAAHALARFSARPILVVAPGESARAILDLPIAALRLPKHIVDGLRVLGFEAIGELAAKPRAPLALRFGPELGRRLDQALGRLSEPIDPARPPELIEEHSCHWSSSLAKRFSSIGARTGPLSPASEPSCRLPIPNCRTAGRLSYGPICFRPTRCCSTRWPRHSGCWAAFPSAGYSII
ncbi:protein imuB, putative damage-inducible mutagenesis protein (plasmid) [Methylocella tundrae]|uniref:Protein imuB, putative damage-inducible mutagenesis protein n=1 Tax=Methylocella tundrae TaxID=227605 RepID=A0A4U8Z7Y6_METTU|nr:protein imuB, putative damage-inducible mutagenesis protein [Methylocella tundrae]